MKLLLCLLLCGCAHTSIYDPTTGRRLLHTQADAINVSFTAPGVSFRADRLDHSTPTLAQGQAAQGKIQAVGAAAAAVGLGSFFAP